MNDTTDRADGLRAWARGMHTLTAAAELLIRSGPPLLTGPWVERDPDAGRYWFNTDTATQEGGYLSGGERRVLDLAAALASDAHPVALGDAVSGLDRKHLDLVLTAIAHAAGSHEGSEIEVAWGEGGAPSSARLIRQGPLHPWPEES